MFSADNAGVIIVWNTTVQGDNWPKEPQRWGVQKVQKTSLFTSAASSIFFICFVFSFDSVTSEQATSSTENTSSSVPIVKESALLFLSEN